MYFENNTGEPNLDHWRKALSELLTADLSQSKYLSVMSGDKLYNILDDLNLLDAQSYSSEDLERVGSRGGVEDIVRGSYTKAGDNFRINIMVQKVNTGELIGSERVEGTGEEGMFTMVDELTKRIKENFELSTEEISSDLDKEVGKITTSSPEAYKYYSEGRRYHTIGENRKSIELMERAIAIDPQFAMAYRSIAVSYNNLFLFAERKKYMEKALEFADRLSERERYIIEGDYYWSSEATYDKSIAAYEKLLELYPDDMIVNHNLAGIYQLLEDHDMAIERYEVCTQAGEEFIHSHTQLADAYAAKGLYDEAKEILRNYIDNISDHVLAHHMLAYLHLDLGEFDQALTETEKAIYLDPTHYENLAIKGDIFYYREEFFEAEEEYLKLMQTSEPAGQSTGFAHMLNLKMLQGKFDEATGLVKKGVEISQKLGQKQWESRWHFGGANFYMRTGNLEEAIKECDEAWKSAEEIGFLLGQRRALYNKGLALLKMGAVEEAKKTANDLKVMIEQGLRKRAIRFYFHLAGMLELEAGNFSRAIQNFNDALSLVPYGPLAKRADFFDSLAQAYYKSGDVEKALDEYERIATLTTGRDNLGDIYARSFYMLGKIHEERGDSADAIENYEKFLFLWKDADIGIAEVEDAQKRLDGLRNQ